MLAVWPALVIYSHRWWVIATLVRVSHANCAVLLPCSGGRESFSEMTLASLHGASDAMQGRTGCLTAARPRYQRRELKAVSGVLWDGICRWLRSLCRSLGCEVENEWVDTTRICFMWLSNNCCRLILIFSHTMRWNKCNWSLGFLKTKQIFAKGAVTQIKILGLKHC